MCSMYWNLTATVTCPECGAVNKDTNLQTHWMGEVGSCLNDYALGAPVDELKGVDVAVPDDTLVGGCEKCHAAFDFEFAVKDGKVVGLWPAAKVKV